MRLLRKSKWLIQNQDQLMLAFLCLAAFLTFALPLEAGELDNISMYLGEVQVLEMGGIERVAIGNPKVVSNTILPQGQLVVLADSIGITTLHIWLKDGSEKQFDVIVKDKEVLDSFQELSSLLADIPGISVVKIGNQTVIKGSIAKKDRSQYDRILARYKDVLDLAGTRDTSSDISRLLEEVPNVSVQDIGGYTVISGEVDDEFDQLIKIVEKKFPNILNMTRVHEAVAGKMIYMKVKIMEVNKKVTESLGIKWQNLTGIIGPSFEFGVEGVRQGGTILNADGTSKVFTKSGNANLTTASGYFGIATGVTSLINLSEVTGDAVVLAEPQLSTRSGGKAEFLAGGEYPLASTSVSGQTTVEFKQYGILLNIEPVVDDQGNILAHIETEISTIDEGQSFGAYKGLLTRKTTTDVSMREKQTLVIAGLVQDLANKDYDKVKWLGDLPVLGPLFRSKDFKNQTTELVIFVTPYVYDASSPLNKESLGKAEKMQQTFDEIVKGRELLE